MYHVEIYKKIFLISQMLLIVINPETTYTQTHEHTNTHTYTNKGDLELVLSFSLLKTFCSHTLYLPHPNPATRLDWSTEERSQKVHQRINSWQNSEALQFQSSVFVSFQLVSCVFSLFFCQVFCQFFFVSSFSVDQDNFTHICNKSLEMCSVLA